MKPSAPVPSSSPEGADRDAKPDRPAKKPAAPAGPAALRGRILDESGRALQGAEVVVRNALDGRQHATSTNADGTFTLQQLPTGIYDLTATLHGFAIDPQYDISLQAGEDRRVNVTAAVDEGTVVTMGITMTAAEPLRQLFAESDLVIAARVGPSAVLDRGREPAGKPADVATELQIERVLKGDVPGRKVDYRHAENLAGSEPQRGLRQGNRVLAFLKASRETGARGEPPSFESAGYLSGVRVLGDAELAAYVERVDALARLQRKAERRGEEDPAELMEWLVATTEDPYTRGEAAFEVRTAVEALAKFAEQEGTTSIIAAADLQALVDRFRGEGGMLSEEPRPAVLGAELTENQKKRLTHALSATKSLKDADLDLFRIVRTLDEEAATAWLIRQLRTAKPDVNDRAEVWSLLNLSMELQNEKMQGLVEAALDREQAIEAREPDGSEADQNLRQRELATLREELRHRLAEELASAQ